jgi:DNA-nicking Smr family endonuclease
MADDSLSDDDKALFRQHMQTVKPLNEKTIRIKEQKTKLPPPKKRFDPAVIKTTDYFLSDFISDTV